MLKLIIFVSTLYIMYCYEFPKNPFSCMDGSPGGFYCSNDLTGYHDCNLDENNKPQDIKHACQPGYRCKCYINSKCHMTEEEICKPRRTFPLIPESFDWTYNEDYLLRSTAVKISLHRYHIVRDDILKRFKKTVFDRVTNEMKSFEIIFPSLQGGKFLKFEGDYSLKTCVRTVIDSFPSFWENWDVYTFDKDFNGQQYWQFQQQLTRDNSNDFIGKIWIVRKLQGIKYFPYRSITRKGEMYGFMDLEKLEFREQMEIPSDVQIPKFCSMECM